jgi:hypothetical protein
MNTEYEYQMRSGEGEGQPWGSTQEDQRHKIFI